MIEWNNYGKSDEPQKRLLYFQFSTIVEFPVDWIGIERREEKYVYRVDIDREHVVQSSMEKDISFKTWQ